MMTWKLVMNCCKMSTKNTYGKELQVPITVAIEAINDGHSFLVHTNMPSSPEIIVAVHNLVRNYASALLERETNAPKHERQLSRKERESVAGAIAYINMVISTQAPILYRDLKMEAGNQQPAENKIEIASTLTKLEP